MLYVINGKNYILVSGYYKEVTIEKRGNSYEVKAIKDANKTKIEASKVKNFTTINVEQAYEKSKSLGKFLDM